MGFTCDGSIFQNLALDTSNSELLATFFAADAWDDAKAEVTIAMGGKEVKKEIDSLCAYISVGTCDSSGDVTLDLTSLVTDSISEGMPWSVVSTVIAASTIEITVEQNDVFETCTKPAGSSGSISSGYQMASSPAKTTSFAIGAIALVGLAAYAMKRHNRATSKTGADEKLYGGELA